MKPLITAILLLASATLFAVDEQAAVLVQEPSFLQILTNGELFTKLIAFIVSLQIVLYAVGEALTRISVYTENKWDNTLSSKISSFAWVLGLVVSKFGYSVPKLVIEEKAKKVEEKKVG